MALAAKGSVKPFPGPDTWAGSALAVAHVSRQPVCRSGQTGGQADALVIDHRVCVMGILGVGKRKHTHFSRVFEDGVWAVGL